MFTKCCITAFGIIFPNLSAKNELVFKEICIYLFIYLIIMGRWIHISTIYGTSYLQSYEGLCLMIVFWTAHAAIFFSET